MLHEALDRAGAGAGAVAQTGGDLLLEVEGQPLLGAAGQIVQMAAHGGQEPFRLNEGRKLGGREHALRRQLAHLVHPVEIFGDPVEGVEVAQPALAFLDIRLDDIAAVAEAQMPLVALGQFPLGEFRAGLLHQLLGEAGAELPVKSGFAPEEARLQQARADRGVPAGEAEAFLDRTGGMADLEARVPEQQQHIFDDLLDPGRDLPGQQEQQVEVRVRGEAAASIAALGRQREAVAGGGVGGRERRSGNEVEQGAHDPVHGVGEAVHCDIGGLPGLEGRAHGPARLLHALLQDCQHPLSGRPRLGAQRIEPGDRPRCLPGALPGKLQAGSVHAPCPRCRQARPWAAEGGPSRRRAAPDTAMGAAYGQRNSGGVDRLRRRRRSGFQRMVQPRAPARAGGRAGVPQGRALPRGRQATGAISPGTGRRMSRCWRRSPIATA